MDMQFMREHLLAWCRRETRSGDDAQALATTLSTYLDTREEWERAFSFGWPWVREQEQAYREYNRDLALRSRNGQVGSGMRFRP